MSYLVNSYAEVNLIATYVIVFLFNLVKRKSVSKDGLLADYICPRILTRHRLKAHIEQYFSIQSSNVMSVKSIPEPESALIGRRFTKLKKSSAIIAFEDLPPMHIGFLKNN